MTRSYASFPQVVKEFIKNELKADNAFSEEKRTISEFVYDEYCVVLNEREFDDFIKTKTIQTYGYLLDDDIEEIKERVMINYNVKKIANDNPKARVKFYYLLNENGQESVEINTDLYDCDECLID